MKRMVIMFLVLLLPSSLLAQGWIAQSSGTGHWLYSVFFTDASTGWVVGDNGTALHTTDGGATWTDKRGGTTETLFSVFFTDASTGWAVGGGGTILHTTNSGSSWTAQTSGTTNDLLSIFFSDASNGWAVGGVAVFPGGEGTIVHTTDGGTSWIAQSMGTSNLYSVFFTDASTGWVVGAGGTILHTADGGTSWTSQTTGTTDHFYSLFFIDASTGWVGGSGLIFHTTDGGASWTGQTSAGEFTHSSIFFTDANTGWTCGFYDGLVFHTTDGGTNWTDQSGETDHWLYSLFFTDDSTGWAVGGGGTILRYSVLVSVHTTVSPASGDGTFDYTIDLTNNTSLHQPSDVWTGVYGPDNLHKVSQVMYGKEIPPNGTRSETTTKQLPEEAPPGEYTIVTYVGTFPGSIMDSSSATYTKTSLGKASLSDIPESTVLLDNYPNPFNPSTTFRYGLSDPGQVTLNVYDMLGQLVKTVVNDYKSEGYHEVIWDGKNEDGMSVASGIYIYRITAGGFNATKSILLLK